MSEGFTIETLRGETAGIVVRWQGERGYRFHAADRKFHALDGHVFATPSAAERAVSDFSADCRRSSADTARVAD